MKNLSAACFAIAALALAPAYGQTGSTNKQCFKRCMDLLTADRIRKIVYDYEAVEKDPAKTDAEKKKSHKKAVVHSCTEICATN